MFKIGSPLSRRD